tara:strand:+ start:22770 stop:23060 length:291 start_codon:yes stop_codon:yes gene_type:complete
LVTPVLIHSNAAVNLCISIPKAGDNLSGFLAGLKADRVVRFRKIRDVFASRFFAFDEYLGCSLDVYLAWVWAFSVHEQTKGYTLLSISVLLGASFY